MVSRREVLLPSGAHLMVEDGRDSEFLIDEVVE